MTSEDTLQENGTAADNTASHAILRPRHPMEALLKNTGSMFLKKGDTVQGTILEKKGTRVYVDLGSSGMGIVYGREYYAAHEILKSLQPGDAISAKVVEVDNDEGYAELSLQEAGKERQWLDIKKMIHEGTAIELTVIKANTGGLILGLFGIEGFLPASQLSFKNYPRVDGGDKEKIFHELQKLVGKTLKVKVLDMNPIENKLIFTEKGVDGEELKALLDRYHKGDVVEGEVTGVVDFGAFVKLNETELEGLIHLSEIDWTLVDDPREVLKIGDRIKAKIIDIQGDKISLSLKQLKEDPWKAVAEKYQKGDTIEGKVTKYNSFGAFVQVERDIQGLIHISEFGREAHMRELLKLDNTYQFRIVLIDALQHKISLGMTRTEQDLEQAA